MRREREREGGLGEQPTAKMREKSSLREERHDSSLISATGEGGRVRDLQQIDGHERETCFAHRVQVALQRVRRLFPSHRRQVSSEPLFQARDINESTHHTENKRERQRERQREL
jgi:hypothetical protein